MELNILPQPQPKKPTYICTPRKHTHNPTDQKKQTRKPNQNTAKTVCTLYGNHNYN